MSRSMGSISIGSRCLKDGRCQNSRNRSPSGRTGTAIPSLLLSIEPGSAVCVDEAQTIFRAREKVPWGDSPLVETHRHYGVDLLLMAQDYRQLTSGVTRLVESTIKFRRMERFGMRKRFQGFVRGNPEETEVIRTLIGRYDPTIYAYYSSYASRAASRRNDA